MRSGSPLLDVLRALADRGQVLVALDDIQWLDPASAGALQIALRRLRDEPLGLLATLRLGPELAGSPVELERSFPDGQLGRLTVGPLSLAALHRLLEERLGLELTRPELARVQEATAGNPFFALELGRELVRTNTRPAPGQPLRVPESLRELLGGRLARLPGETLDVLLLVAALARPTVELVAATYGERERVLEALETAAQEAVVELDDANVRFAHPLLGSICYERAPLWKRRAVHRALAGAVSEVEERARHLALAADGPDPVAAAYLEAASEQAAARGAPGAAAELCGARRRADRGDPALARARRFRAAMLHRMAGDGEEALAILEQLLVDATPGPERSDILYELALSQAERPSYPDRALRRGTGRGGGRRRALRPDPGSSRGNAPASRPTPTRRWPTAGAAVDRAERAGDPTVLAQAISYTGQAETYHAETTSGLARARRRDRGGGRAGARVELESELRARTPADAPRGDRPRPCHLRAPRGAGGVTRGRGQPGDGALVVDRTGVARRSLEPRARARRGGVRADGADAARARSSLGRTCEGAPRSRPRSRRAGACLGRRGSLHSRRRWATRSSSSRRSASWGASSSSSAISNPPRATSASSHGGSSQAESTTRRFRSGPDAIETLVGLGELERARSYLESYEVHAERLGSPYARAGAARCRGLLLAGEGDLAGALAAFERSLADAEPFPLEHARTLLCLGTVRRQAKQKRASREALEQALAIFEELGARLWAEKARVELRRISGRAPASDELTETERRVAGLAAQGRTNREIAAELFMGVSTVEAHLSHVYRKLGVRRAELAGSLERAEAR